MVTCQLVYLYMIMLEQWFTKNVNNYSRTIYNIMDLKQMLYIFKIYHMNNKSN